MKKLMYGLMLVSATYAVASQKNTTLKDNRPFTGLKDPRLVASLDNFDKHMNKAARTVENAKNDCIKCGVATVVGGIVYSQYGCCGLAAMVALKLGADVVYSDSQKEKTITQQPTALEKKQA